MRGLKMGRLKYWFRSLRNKRGEGSVSTGVKVIIAVVIGALILGGLYLLFAGDDGILSKVSGEVEDMMGYTNPVMTVPLAVFSTVEITRCLLS